MRCDLFLHLVPVEVFARVEVVCETGCRLEFHGAGLEGPRVNHG